MVKIAIVGSRNFTNYHLFKQIVLNLLKDFQNDYPNFDYSSITIVSGGAQGADTLAKKFATEYNYDFIVFPPDWNTHGKAAGPIRNTLIVNECTHMIAFPSKSGSIGTQDSITKAKNNHKFLKIYEVD